MQNTIEINTIRLVFIGIVFVLIFTTSFLGLFLAFKKRLEREQEALRTAEINFERQINEATLQAEQQERVQIAMDLHDEIGALVTVLKINVLNAQHRLNQPDQLFGLLSETSDMIEKTAETIRRISHRISPPTLVKLGLDPTLVEMSKTIQATGKMLITLKSNLDGGRFRLESELNIYRIIIETINNILKHSHTEEVQLQLNQSKINLKISFSYVGLGLNDGQVKLLLRQEKGSGLKSIQSRINHLRGNISYLTNERGNTAILIHIPLHEITN